MGEESLLFPTGDPVDILHLENEKIWKIQATLVHAGSPTIFIDATDLGKIMQQSLNELPDSLSKTLE